MLKKPFTPKIIYPTGKLLLTTTMISIGIGLVNNTTVSADTKSPNYVKTASDPQTTDKSEIQTLSRHFDFDSMFSVTSQFSRYLGKNDPMNPDSYRTTQLFGGSADVSLKYQVNKDEGTVTVTDCQIKWTPNIALSNRANPATKESYFGLYFQVPYPKKYSDIDFSAGLSDRESYISRNKFFNMTKNPDLQAISVMYRDVSQNYNNYQYMENHDWVPYTVPITDGKADLLRPAMRTNSFSDSGSNSGDVYYTQANDMKDIIITLAKQITVDPAKQGDEKITGKGDEGAQLTVTDGAGNEIGTGSINNDGTYSVSTKRPLKGGEVITVQAKNPDGSTDAAHVTVSGEAPKAADVTVNYVDPDGHPLTKAETLTGNYDDPYTTTKKDIKGYTFKEVKGKENGTFSDAPQTVTYVYTPNQAADVTVNYVDPDGHPLTKTETLTGNYDDPYTTTKKDIKGYTFKEVKGQESGKFSDAPQTVTYVYTANQAANVTVNYVDPDGHQLAEPEKLTGNYDDPYTTTKKDIEGYTFKEVKGKENGTFSDAAQTVTYVYTANATNNVPTPQKRPDDSQQSNGEKPKQPIDSSVGSEKNQEKKDPEPQKSKPEPQSKNQPAGSSSNGSSTNSDKNNNKKQPDANIAKKIITAGKQQIDRLLPKTGSQQTAGLTMIGTLLIFISSIIYFRKHK